MLSLRSSLRTNRREPGCHCRDGAQRVSSGWRPGAIHRRIELGFCRLADAEFLGQRRGVPPARGGELGLWRQDARGQHGEHPLALARRPAGEQRGHAELRQRGLNRLDVAMSPRLGDFEQRLEGIERFALQGGPDHSDLIVGERREVGDGALFDLAAFAVGLPQQVGGSRSSIGYDVYMHTPILKQKQPMSAHLHGYTSHTSEALCYPRTLQNRAFGNQKRVKFGENFSLEPVLKMLKISEP
jgi:hypothetical protein